MSVIEIKNSNEVSEAFGITKEFFNDVKKHIIEFEKDLSDQFIDAITDILESDFSNESMEKLSSNTILNVNKKMQNLLNVCDPVRPNEFAFVGYLMGSIISLFNQKTKDLIEREYVKREIGNKLGGLGDLGDLLSNLFKKD